MANTVFRKIRIYKDMAKEKSMLIILMSARLMERSEHKSLCELIPPAFLRKQEGGISSDVSRQRRNVLT